MYGFAHNHEENDMVHGIEDGKRPSELSDEDLLFIREQMSRNRDQTRLYQLEEWDIEPVDDFEREYVEVCNELNRRGLLMQNLVS